MIYGDTPLRQAIVEAGQRFNRARKTINDECNLLIISDGEPTDGDPTPGILEIKQTGVTVVCCYITDDDIVEPRTLVATVGPRGNSGACLLFAMASEVKPNGILEQDLVRMGWTVQANAKMFIQANHTAVLDEFVRACGSTSTASPQQSLPKGR